MPYRLLWLVLALSSTPALALTVPLASGADAEVSLAPCTAQSRPLCVFVIWEGGQRKIELGSFSERKSGSSFGAELSLVGNHAGTATPEVSVLYQRAFDDSVAKTVPAIGIVDVDAGRLLSYTIGVPSGRETQLRLYYTDIAWDRASGKGYPFLAPGHEDLPQSKLTPATVDHTARSLLTWGYLCLLSPGVGTRGRCGPGFVEITTTPTDTEYGKANGGLWCREFGGFLFDSNSDGWDDIHLLFKGGYQVISTKTAATLYTIPLDPSAAFRSRTGLPPAFDSYRIRGIQSAFQLPTGGKRAVLVSGIPVGYFSDHTCAVTRFTGVMGMTATGGLLKWSDYYGFATPIFSEVSKTYESSSARFLIDNKMIYQGEMINKCIHFFGDGRGRSGPGQDISVVSYFLDADTSPKCVKEAYLAQLNGGAAYDAYYGCMLSVMCNAVGTWKIKVNDIATGAQLSGGSNVYVWGWSDDLDETGKTIYVIESLASFGSGQNPYDFPGRVNLDRFGVQCRHTPAAPTADLKLVTLESRPGATGLFFTNVATLPPVRPKILSDDPGGSRGTGSSIRYPKLNLRPSAAGAREFQLENGKWFGKNPDGTWTAK